MGCLASREKYRVSRRESELGGIKPRQNGYRPVNREELGPSIRQEQRASRTSLASLASPAQQDQPALSSRGQFDRASQLRRSRKRSRKRSEEEDGGGGALDTSTRSREGRAEYSSNYGNLI